MRAHESKNATEEERLRAVRMVVQQGVSSAVVAATLGRSQRTINVWAQKSQQGRKLSALWVVRPVSSGRGVKQEDLIEHLRGLWRWLGRPLVVVLDKLPTHKGRLRRQWCDRIGDARLEFLPPYAPELNPIEGVWSHGKCVTAAGRAVDDLAELEPLARESVDAASEQSLLRGFLKGTNLPVRFDL